MIEIAQRSILWYNRYKNLCKGNRCTHFVFNLSLILSDQLWLAISSHTAGLFASEKSSLPSLMIRRQKSIQVLLICQNLPWSWNGPYSRRWYIRYDTNPDIPNSLELPINVVSRLSGPFRKTARPHPNATKIAVKNERKSISVTGISIGAEKYPGYGT